MSWLNNYPAAASRPPNCVICRWSRWMSGRRVTQPGSLRAALRWSEAEMALCLRAPSGLRGFHIPKQLAATLMRTTQRLVVTINALDACRQDGRRTVDVMFWSLQARGGWHICAWLVWPGMLPPHPPLLSILALKLVSAVWWMMGIWAWGFSQNNPSSVMQRCVSCSSMLDHTIKGNLPAWGYKSLFHSELPESWN